MPAPQPTMIYDGNCRFCRDWIQRWRQITGPQVRYLPLAEAGLYFPWLSVEQLQRAVHFVLPSGETYSGAAAVFRCLDMHPVGRLLWGLYQRLPGFAWLTEQAYGMVARHRDTLLQLTRWAERLHLLRTVRA